MTTRSTARRLARTAAAILAPSLPALGAAPGLLVDDAPAGLLRPSAETHGYAAWSGLDTRTDVVRGRFATLDDALIASPRAGAATTVTLNLFDDTTLDVVFDRVEQGLDVDRILVGRVEGSEESYAVMVETDGQVWMDVWTLDAGQYEVRHAGGDVHFIAQVARERVADRFGGVFCAVDCSTVVDGGGPVETGAGEEGDRDSGDLVDVLVMYTAAIRQSAGGTTNIVNAMNGWITSTNVYYTNSQIIQRVRLVHTVETSYVEASGGQGGMNTDLSRFSGTGDSFMAEVHTLRNTYGADICELVSNSSGSCGLAWCMSNPGPGFAGSAFGVTNYFCGVSTFAHELGHNMGCAHDHANVDCSGSYCYSHGYRTPSGGMRTIMAYPPGTQIPYFSNPNITVSGQVIGVSQGAGCGNNTAADNVSTINTNRTWVANFRQQQVGNPPPSPFDIASPPNGSTGQTTQPILEWEPSEFANTYDLVLSEESDLSPAILSQTGIAITAFVVPAAVLESCTQYYWRVTAVGFGGETVGSPTTASFTTRLVGDINGSGTVDFADLNQLVFAFGQSGDNLPADVDGDDDVDFADLNLLLSNYNLSCG